MRRVAHSGCALTLGLQVDPSTDVLGLERLACSCRCMHVHASQREARAGRAVGFFSIRWSAHCGSRPSGGAACSCGSMCFLPCRSLPHCGLTCCHRCVAVRCRVGAEWARTSAMIRQRPPTRGCSPCRTSGAAARQPTVSTAPTPFEGAVSPKDDLPNLTLRDCNRNFGERRGLVTALSSRTQACHFISSHINGSTAASYTLITVYE